MSVPLTRLEAEKVVQELRARMLDSPDFDRMKGAEESAHFWQAMAFLDLAAYSFRLSVATGEQ